MKISTSSIKELREQSGAGVMDCRNALVETDGDIAKAIEKLKAKSLYTAQKKSGRATDEGLIEAYLHTANRIGALIEVNSESDFVARTDEFKALAHDLAMQVAAAAPQYVQQDDIPEDCAEPAETICLLMQPFIKDPSKTVQDVINEAIGKLGENIQVKRFARFELGC